MKGFCTLSKEFVSNRIFWMTEHHTLTVVFWVHTDSLLHWKLNHDLFYTKIMIPLPTEKRSLLSRYLSWRLTTEKNHVFLFPHLVYAIVVYVTESWRQRFVKKIKIPKRLKREKVTFQPLCPYWKTSLILSMTQLLLYITSVRRSLFCKLSSKLLGILQEFFTVLRVLLS